MTGKSIINQDRMYIIFLIFHSIHEDNIFGFLQGLNIQNYVDIASCIASEEGECLGRGFRKDIDSILLTFLEGGDVNKLLEGFKKFKASNKLYGHMRLFVVPAIQYA